MDEVRPFPKSYAAAQARLRILERCLRKEQPLAAVAWEAGISVTTLARWLSQYRRDGLEGLMRRPRQFSAPPAMKPEIRTAIEELAGRQPAVRVRPLYRQVRQNGKPARRARSGILGRSGDRAWGPHRRKRPPIAVKPRRATPFRSPGRVPCRGTAASRSRRKAPLTARGPILPGETPQSRAPHPSSSPPGLQRAELI
jgi:transposase-like protein